MPTKKKSQTEPYPFKLPKPKMPKMLKARKVRPRAPHFVKSIPGAKLKLKPRKPKY